MEPLVSPDLSLCFCLMVGLTLVFRSEGFSCELISLLCYHCLLEVFSLGLFAFMTLVYYCFHWGFTIHGKTVPQFS
jgi:hypothetical protein